MKCKPIAGYPSRTDACLALSDKGLTTRQIADRLRLNTSTVAALIAYRKRRAGIAALAERPLDENGRAIVVSNDVLDALLPAAARRRIGVDQLVRDLLGIIVDDGMIDSVLDDAAEFAPATPARRAA